MAVGATVTGVTGPGQAITALALTGVSAVNFDYTAGIVSITYTPNGSSLARTLQIMLPTLTTITCTVSGGNTDWVLS